MSGLIIKQNLILPAVDLILKKLQSLGSEESKAGMSRFGINVERAYGVSVPNLRKVAKEIGKDHELALKLWDSEIHEARILASMIDDPRKVTETQVDSWVHDFDSWDVCDGACGNLFDNTQFAYSKAIEYSTRREEFVKRAGFVLMAELAVHNKEMTDDKFLSFLPIILRESNDDRNFVKKAVNWALRQVGKRNLRLNKAAIKTAQRISKLGSKSTRWISSDALRELTSKGVQSRLKP